MPTMVREDEQLGLQPGYQLCFFCGDPDEGDDYLHNGVPICVVCEDVHEFLRNLGESCCEPPDWSVGDDGVD